MLREHPESSRVTVQVVLYQNEAETIHRLIRSVVTATGSLESRLGRRQLVSLRLGDCSPQPSLTENQQRVLLREASRRIDDCTYSFFDANLGSAGGSNRLATSAASEFILVLNPDTVLGPNSMVKFMERFRTEPDIGIADARQLPLEHPKDYAESTGDTSWVSGACMWIRREVFNAVGGFDAIMFPLYCDDVDFSWRVRSAGHRAVHVPESHVFHDKSLTLNGDVEASRTEVVSSALARLKLTMRWGRPDIHEATLSWLVAQPRESAYYEAAQAWYHDLRVHGAIERLADVSAAQFSEGEYADHRF